MPFFEELESDNSDEARYQRIVEEEGPNKMFMLLLVCMVMIGVLVGPENGMGSETTISTNTVTSQSLQSTGRLLLAEDLKQIGMGQQTNQLVPAGAIQSYNSVNTCLKEYEEYKRPQQVYHGRSSLRSENPHLMKSMGYEVGQHDVLVCSVPQIIKRTEEPSLLSNIFEILMKGSEVVRILGQGSTAMSPNSLYVVLAEVKEVASYPNFKCLV